MVDRIREILSARQLTPTQFADTIGVARPIISHILSGRNKPSLEVVQKIIAAYPGLSLPWLLSGVGSMNAGYTAAETAEAAFVAPTSRRMSTGPSETARPGSNKAKVQPEAVPIRRPVETLDEKGTHFVNAHTPVREVTSLPLFPTPVASHSASLEEQLPNDPRPSATAQATPTLHESFTYNHTTATKPMAAAEAGDTARTTTSVASVAQPFAESGKAIRRIVIFYQDGTFTDYQPENK